MIILRIKLITIS